MITTMERSDGGEKQREEQNGEGKMNDRFKWLGQSERCIHEGELKRRKVLRGNYCKTR
jgi:hypothetical protein